MNRIQWNEETITFRSLVDNASIPKPALGKQRVHARVRASNSPVSVQIGTKLIFVGEKLKGEFIMGSPCKPAGERFETVERDMVLSSKHPGLS